MNAWIIILIFFVIASLRVVQRIGNKKVSNEIKGSNFFCYGAYYNFLSAVFSLVALIKAGFYGIDFPTILCALATAGCLTVGLFASIEGLKGASLIVNQMFGVSALIIPCIVGNFFFNEPVSIWQWGGIVLFAVAMYFIVSPTKQRGEKKKQKISLKTMCMLFLTFLADGGTMVSQKSFSVLIPNGNVAAYSFLMFALNAVILFTCYITMISVKKIKSKKVEVGMENAKLQILSKTALIQGVILAFAIFLINILVTNLGRFLDSAILFSISYAISIIVTALVGAIYYKEKIAWKNMLGIALCVVAISIINFL